MIRPASPTVIFFFNDTATTEIYTLSLHDALPILLRRNHVEMPGSMIPIVEVAPPSQRPTTGTQPGRSEEHTSELQSQSNLVCRLLLEKNKTHARVGPLTALSGAVRIRPVHSVPSALTTQTAS